MQVQLIQGDPAELSGNGPAGVTRYDGPRTVKKYIFEATPGVSNSHSKTQ